MYILYIYIYIYIYICIYIHICYIHIHIHKSAMLMRLPPDRQGMSGTHVAAFWNGLPTIRSLRHSTTFFPFVHPSYFYAECEALHSPDERGGGKSRLHTQRGKTKAQTIPPRTHAHTHSCALSDTHIAHSKIRTAIPPMSYTYTRMHTHLVLLVL
jgi:hypothetical protein